MKCRPWRQNKMIKIFKLFLFVVVRLVVAGSCWTFCEQSLSSVPSSQSLIPSHLCSEIGSVKSQHFTWLFLIRLNKSALLTLNKILLMLSWVSAALPKIEVFLVDSMALVFLIDLDDVQWWKSLCTWNNEHDELFFRRFTLGRQLFFYRLRMK